MTYYVFVILTVIFFALGVWCLNVAYEILRKRTPPMFNGMPSCCGAGIMGATSMGAFYITSHVALYL